MGFLDKVKEQAEKAKGQAQDLKGKVGDKVEEVQGKRKVDDLLAELGRFLYAEQTGRPRPTAGTEVPRIVEELKTLEADGATVLPTATATAPAPDPAASAGAQSQPGPPPPATSGASPPPDLPV